jgi:hypothetical protein
MRDVVYRALEDLPDCINSKTVFGYRILISHLKNEPNVKKLITRRVLAKSPGDKYPYISSFTDWLGSEGKVLDFLWEKADLKSVDDTLWSSWERKNPLCRPTLKILFSDPQKLKCLKGQGIAGAIEEALNDLETDLKKAFEIEIPNVSPDEAEPALSEIFDGPTLRNIREDLLEQYEDRYSWYVSRMKPECEDMDNVPKKKKSQCLIS